MSWVDKKAEYLEIAHQVDKAIILTTKDSWFWKMLAWVLWVCTFGGIEREKFLKHYATTIGPVQAYPRGWKQLTWELLIHEGRHTRQCRWFSLGIHPWLGLPLFTLFFTFLPVPMGFAFFRWRFEIDADRAAWRWALLFGSRSPDWVRQRAKFFGGRVCGRDYGWSWIWGGVRGFEKAAEKLIAKVEAEQAAVAAAVAGEREPTEEIEN